MNPVSPICDQKEPYFLMKRALFLIKRVLRHHAKPTQPGHMYTYTYTHKAPIRCIHILMIGPDHIYSYIHDKTPIIWIHTHMYINNSYVFIHICIWIRSYVCEYIWMYMNTYECNRIRMIVAPIICIHVHVIAYMFTALKYIYPPAYIRVSRSGVATQNLMIYMIYIYL